MSADKIKKINLRFRPSKLFKEALNKAKFRPAEEMVGKRK